tara:strand:- start:335 stop:1504 length:1170 start_codon:yes stop_codon:yes gene_type:complete
MASLLAKPCQSGKTFELLQKTTALIERNSKCIHIILVDNNLIQLDQLYSRVKSATNMDILVLNSNHNISVNLLEKKLCQNRIKYVLLCANMIQLKKIDKLINRMLTTRIPGCSGKVFYIWIDEGDKIGEPANIDLFDDWIEYENVNKLCYITATPHSLIVRYNRMNVLKVNKVYNRKTYNKWSDCNVITIKPDGHTVESYIKKAFKIKPPQYGDIWLITPGNLCDTHDEITQFLNRYGFYTLTVNALGEIYTTPGGIQKELKGREPLSDRINKLYKTNKLFDKKFAMVGYNRLGRGITLQSKGVLINRAVFPTTSKNKAAIYQLAGRLCGNYKAFSGFRIPLIFCTEYFDKVAYESEDIIIDIAKMSSIDKNKYKKLEKKAEIKYKKNS